VATAFVTHPDFLLHDTGPFHLERPERLTAIERALADAATAHPQLFRHLNRIEPDIADLSSVTAVHDALYVEAVSRWCEGGLRRLPTGDTQISRLSYQAALRAAGAGLAAIDAVAVGKAANAFCAVRPPGHHAEHEGGMGFCIFNNIAIAARHAQRAWAMQRVFILDWDVHHGNGTQHIFEEDPLVFFASIHQWPHYPYTGATWEIGEGRGKGYTLNVPVAAGAGDEVYREAFEKYILPAAHAFAPDIVLLSAGFDAHHDDLLSGTEVTESGFSDMLRRVMEMTDACCGGRLVSMLEGGYHVETLGRCTVRHIEMMLERGVET